MKFRIEGTRNGVRWPEAGGEIDLPDNEATDLLNQGFAEAVGTKPVEKAEKAVAAEPETREAAPKKRAAKKA